MDQPSLRVRSPAEDNDHEDKGEALWMPPKGEALQERKTASAEKEKPGGRRGSLGDAAGEVFDDAADIGKSAMKGFGKVHARCITGFGKSAMEGFGTVCTQ